MGKRSFLTLVIISLNIIQAQDSTYFNKILNPENTYATGRSILQIGNSYFGLCGTEINSSIGIKLGLFELDLIGNLINWKIIGENNHHYFPGIVGGILIRTNDDNLAFACHVQDINTAYSTLVKLNLELDTIWKKDYYTENYWTLAFNCRQTSDNGYILVGSVKPTEESFWDFLLLKTDSLGNMQWYQSYSYYLQEEAETVIQTPDGGYLIGGFRYDPAVNHSLDALVIKTDSLGNEEWTKTFGNPNVDDDMAHVDMADDGNYLVATVFGEFTFGIDSRIGKQRIYKVNQQGQIIDTYYPGVSRLHNYIRNFRKENDGYIMTGFSYETDSVTMALYTGWMMKTDNNIDSVWYRDYTHFNQLWDDNYLYDINACEDNGYIAIGEAHPDMGTEKLWVIKVDSMGCDTAGCATGTKIFELPAREKTEVVKIYPNPATSDITIAFQNTDHHKNMMLECYNIYGMQVHTEKIWKGQQETRIDLRGWAKGLYFAVVKSEGTLAGSVRFIRQ